MVLRWGHGGSALAVALALACVCGASGGGVESLSGRARLGIERGAHTCHAGCQAALLTLSSTLLSRLEPFSARLPLGPRGPFILSTDLDDTLVGDRQSLARFNEVWLSQCAPRGSKLVYNTGRSLDDYMLLAKEWVLLVPDVFIGGCGTQIYTFDDYGRPVADSAWLQRLQKGWNKTAVIEASEGDPSLAERYGPIAQKKESARNPYMYSCKVPRGEGATAEGIRRDFEGAMRRAGLAVQVGAASVAYSASSTVQGGARPGEAFLYVDVLPLAAGKGNAQAHVQRGLGFPPEQTVVAGDSGNDVPMFAGGRGERGILVGNAREELLAAKQSHHTRARRCHAAGVLEGLERLCLVDAAAEERLASAQPPMGLSGAALKLVHLGGK